MERLNRVIEQHGRWAALKTYTDRIEAFSQTDFSQSLENAKSLIEAICLQICKENGIEVKPKTSFNKVLQMGFNAIGYPRTASVNQITTALGTIGLQMGELRNDIGCTSHGKTSDELEGRNDKIDMMTKELLIDTTVVIASFLIRNFENKNPRIPSITSEQKISLTDNQDFNDFWDETYGDFNMGNYSYTASEILFFVDSKAYLTELMAFRGTE